MISVVVLCAFGACGLLCWKKPILAVVAAWLAWNLVPWLFLEAQFDNLSVAGLAVHPGTALLLGAVIGVLLFRGASLTSLIRSGWITFGLLALVLIWSVLVTVVGNPYGLGILLNQLMPIFFTLFLSSIASADNPRAMLVLRNVVVWTIAAQSSLALVQVALQDFLVYESAYSVQRWALYATVFRATGSFDHYLVLSLATVIALPLVKGMNLPAFIRVALVFLLVAGNATTQSRVGLVLALAMGVFVLVSAGSGSLVKIVTVVAAIGFGTLFMASDLFGNAAARFANDSGSASARNRAIDLFFKEIQDRFFIGDGISSSYDIAQRGFLLTSLESPLMMLSIDIGLLMSLVFVGVIISAAVTVCRGQKRIPGATLAALAAVAVTMSFSSFMAQGASGMLLAVALTISWRGEGSGGAMNVVVDDVARAPARTRTKTGNHRVA